MRELSNIGSLINSLFDMLLAEELANCIVGNYCGLYFRSFFKRSLSDGNILRESSSPMSNTNIKQDLSSCAFSDDQSRGSKILCESSPEISTCESEVTISRSVFSPSSML